MNLKKLSKASMLLLTLNLACFPFYGDAATALTPTPMGVENSRTIAVAVDNNNNAIAVYDDVNDLINARYSPGNLSYEPPVIISNNFTRQQEPDVAMDATSTAIAVWSGVNGGGDSTLETNTLINGVWGTPQTLDTSIFEIASASVAMDGSGNAVAVWIDRDIGETRASLYDGATQTWAPFDVLSAPGDAGRYTDVAYSSNGTIIVSWTHFDFLISDLFVTAYVSGSWLPQTLVDSFGADVPSVGVDDAGNGLAIWIDGNGDIKWSRFDGTTWSSSEILFAGPDNTNPSIAVAPNGTAIAVWTDSSGILRISEFNGTSWSAPVASFPATDANVTMDSLGNALIGWSIDDTLSVASLPLGGVIGEPVLITSGGPFIDGIELALSSGSSTGVVGWLEGGEGFSDSFATFVLFDSAPSLEISGSVCKNNFAMQSDRVHIINWTPSTDPTTSAYHIYRNGVLISIVPATGPFTFYDHNRSKGSPDTYTIYAVNTGGDVSAPVSITLD